MQALQCGVGRHTETFKMSVYIHIYVALIPYRRNMSPDDKKFSMQRLRDYFQSKTEECTKDEEVLKYFALPFVQDPHAHPIFSKLLTVSILSFYTPRKFGSILLENMGRVNKNFVNLFEGFLDRRGAR